jgi:hypothetical protein
MGHQEVTAALPALPFLEAAAVVMALLVTVLMEVAVAVAVVALPIPQVAEEQNAREVLEDTENRQVPGQAKHFLAQEEGLVDTEIEVNNFLIAVYLMVDSQCPQVWAALTPQAARVEIDGIAD